MGPRDAFVGRSAEIAVMRAAALESRAGNPVVVFLEGDAGSGKTVLARHGLQQLGADTTVVTIVADEQMTTVPLALLRSWIDTTTNASPFEAGLALLDRFGDLADGPLLAVLVEDLHWADPASRQALLATARRLDHERILMLVTTRPDVDGGDDGWERFRADLIRCRRVPVGPLTAQEIAELAAATGISLTRRAAHRLRIHTDGNALYVATMLREFPAERLNAANRELPAPHNLAATVAARLETIPPGARELIAALAVVNEPTPLPRLAAIADIADPFVALDALLGTGYVTWRRDDPISAVAFSHPVYRAAFYEGLAAQQRRRLHVAAAGATDRVASLRHRVAAADRLDDTLADELVAASHIEKAPATAAQLLGWSADLTTDGAVRERRLLDAARLLLRAGDLTAVAARRSQIDTCQPGPLRDLIDGQLSWHDGDADTAERLLLDASRSAEPDVAAEALVLLTNQYNARSRGPEAVATATRAIELGRHDADVERTAWSARAIGIGMLDGAAAGLDSLGARLPDAPGEVSRGDAGLLTARGVLHYYAARPTRAVADLREVTRRLRPNANPDQLRRAHVHLAQALFTIGDWDDALINAHLALDLLIEDDHRWERAQAHQAAASVVAGRGHWDDAQRHVDAANAAAEAAGTIESLFGAHLAAAAVHRARDEPDAVVATLQPLIGDGSAVPMFTTLGWWVPYIRALIDTGQLGAADQHITLLEAASRRRRIDLTARLHGLRAAHAAASDRLDDAETLYGLAVATVGDDDPVLDVATVHADYGRLLRRLGRRQAALDHLRLARITLDAIGAVPFVTRIDAELTEAGLSRPRRRRGSPLELTPREHDVATLVARGLTNKEIAAELYVSSKAVEYHLGNIFGKLGISSRRALRDVSC